MLREISAYRAKSFISERDTSSIAYEVKRTRAVFDDSLAIPGTDRRGGWRCPPGTRYGGQITDRFGRNCGWGVSRRLANEISDLGERLENIGDRRRGRRVNRRNERVVRRMQEGGRLERAARGIANALDSTETVEAPKAPRTRRGGGKVQRSRKPNFRDSELRRIEREIDQPGAPRTGEGDVPPARRPRPNAPAARRRPATQQVTREKPKPEVDAPEAPAPAKKAPVKKAAAKKKAVKKKAPAKKAAARRVTPAAGGNDEPPKLVAKPKKPAVKPEAENPVREKIRAAGFIGVGDEPLNADELSRFAGLSKVDFEEAQREIDVAKKNVLRDMNAWGKENINELRGNVANQDRYVKEAKRELQDALDKMRADGPDANNNDFEIMQIRVLQKNRDYAMALNRRNAFKNRLEELSGGKAPKAGDKDQPDWDAFGRLDVGLGIDWNELDGVLGDLYRNEDWALSPRDRENRLIYEREQLDQFLQRRNADREAFVATADSYDRQKAQYQRELREAMLRFENEPDAAQRKQIAKEIYNINTSLKDAVMRRDAYADRAAAMANNQGAADKPAAVVPEDLAPDVAAAANKRVQDAIKNRKKVLSKYLDERYGKGNAPWKEMTQERRMELIQKLRNGTPEEKLDAERQLREWATAMYTHDEIKGTNGRTYRIVLENPPYVERDGQISIGLRIEHKKNDGSWETVGSSGRTIFAGSDRIYHNTMFIRGAKHKNSGIATIYNQHSWMYARAAGFEKVSVSAVDDGPYVWGRMGFEDPANLGARISRMDRQLENFRNGRPSIIKNENDANLIEYLIRKQQADPNSVRHMDFIYALSNNEVGQAKKDREQEIKDWFLANMPFSSGAFYLEKNEISADPRDEKE